MVVLTEYASESKDFKGVFESEKLALKNLKQYAKNLRQEYFSFIDIYEVIKTIDGNSDYTTEKIRFWVESKRSTKSVYGSYAITEIGMNELI